MDAIIPLLNKSPNNFQELRYSLRSLDKWLNPDNVILVGGKPDWYTGTHIPHADVDSMYWKEKNICDKVLAGCAASSENFIYTNDDFFVFAPYWGMHHKGTVLSTMEKKSPAGSYYKLLENTVKLFGAGCLNYDTHCPIIMSRSGVKYMASKLDWSVKFGYGFKTSFVYSMGMEDIGTYYPDAKYQFIPDVIDRPYISTEDSVRNLHVLDKYFPHKSRFEK